MEGTRATGRDFRATLSREGSSRSTQGLPATITTAAEGEARARGTAAKRTPITIPTATAIPTAEEGAGGRRPQGPRRRLRPLLEWLCITRWAPRLLWWPRPPLLPPWRRWRQLQPRPTLMGPRLRLPPLLRLPTVLATAPLHRRWLLQATAVAYPVLLPPSLQAEALVVSTRNHRPIRQALQLLRPLVILRRLFRLPRCPLPPPPCSNSQAPQQPRDLPPQPQRGEEATITITNSNSTLRHHPNLVPSAPPHLPATDRGLTGTITRTTSTLRIMATVTIPTLGPWTAPVRGGGAAGDGGEGGRL